MSLYSALISHDIAALGTVKASNPVTVSSSKGLVWTTTSSGTWNPFQMTNTMTQAGTTGGRMYVELTTDVALGGWCNAIKAYMNFGTSGRVAGLASAINAEIKIQGATESVGTYAPLESEIVVEGLGAGASSVVSFLYMNVTGGGLSRFNDTGYLFHLGAGITDTGSGLFDANPKSSINMTHALRIMVNGVDYFLPLHTSVDFGV